jgi:hypothetical protein
MSKETDWSAWVDEQRSIFKAQRGYVRTALEYRNNQQDALMRFFDDGRLLMANNRSERAVKVVVLGGNTWLFVGSDDNAESTAARFSIVTSARLHRIEFEAHIRCLLRLAPLWPADRKPLAACPPERLLDAGALAELSARVERLRELTSVSESDHSEAAVTGPVRCPPRAPAPNSAKHCFPDRRGAARLRGRPRPDRCAGVADRPPSRA